MIIRSVYYPALIIIIVLFLPVSGRFFQDVGLRWTRILLLSFGISYCMTPVCGWFAEKFGVVDQPDQRKSHHRVTPLLGGGAVFFAFLVSLLINGIYTPKLAAILTSATLLFIVGAADDFREIPAWIKLAVQLFCTGMVMSKGIVLHSLPDSLGFFSIAGNAILTILWIIGITNAMNFFDGMDGLAAGLSAIIAFFLGIVAFETDQPFLGWIAVSMMGSSLGFLPYNFRKNGNAHIFLGDAGSTVMGFVLGCIAVHGVWAENDLMASLISPILIFWLLIFDMIHITVDRIQSGKVKNVKQWIDYVGKDHMHHRLASALGGNKKSVLFIYMMSISLGISAVVLRNAKILDALLLLFQAMIIVILITILERRGRNQCK